MNPPPPAARAERAMGENLALRVQKPGGGGGETESGKKTSDGGHRKTAGRAPVFGGTYIRIYGSTSANSS